MWSSHVVVVHRFSCCAVATSSGTAQLPITSRATAARAAPGQGEEQEQEQHQGREEMKSLISRVGTRVLKITMLSKWM